MLQSPFATQCHIVVELFHQDTAIDRVSIFDAISHIKQNLSASEDDLKNVDDACNFLGPNSSHCSSINITAIDMAYYKGKYESLGMESTTLRCGIVHLYRDQADSILQCALPLPAGYHPQNRNVVAFLAVPIYMTAADFLGYIGGDVQKQVSHLRMIRTASQSQYMVLLKFRRGQDAAEFQAQFNGRNFNALDPETVHCVMVTAISFKGGFSASQDFPQLLDREPESNLQKLLGLKRPIAPVTAPLLELPTCVVCLERMDSAVTGLLTISCEHTFHCNCIAKWVDTQSTCPICRFSTTRDLMENPHKACLLCESEKNLWMCLICGNVACGRYESQHAIAHSEHTNHSFAMDLDSGRIWDYSSDSYVHRLVQDKLDAKPSASKRSAWEVTETEDQGTEFQELLATQLESQRLFYEEQVKASVDKASRVTKESETKSVEITLARAKVEALQSSVSRITTELHEQRQVSDGLSEKVQVLSKLSRKLETQYKDEHCMNSSLMARIAFMEAQREELTTENSNMRKEMTELKEQLSDLYTHLSASAQLKGLESSLSEDVRAGSISLSKTTLTQSKK